MKVDFKNKKNLQVMIFTLVAIITLGVGYATISAINLVINGNATANVNQSNFSVVFKSASVTPGKGTATINNQDATIAYFDVSGLSSAGDTAVATYTIKNESNGVGASISLNVTNSNTEYFTVEESILDTELQAGDSTTATITVTLTKTILEDNVTTSITGTLTASPLENGSATGSTSASVIPAPPVVAPAYKYSISGEQNNIGQALVGEQPSFETAKIAYGHPVSTAHILSGGVITESYVAFEKNNTVYYLKGLVNEENEASHPVYDENVATLQEAFGPEWQSKCEDNGGWLTCRDNGFYADTYKSGSVSAGHSVDNWFCTVNFSGVSWCYY